MRIQPAPLSTKLLTNDTLTTPWYTWFRNVSKNLEDGCIVYNANNYQYNLQNNLMCILYNGAGGDIDLPYTVAADSFLTYYIQIDGVWIPYLLNILKGDTKISIPEGDVCIKDFILVDQKNR